jgi:LacI family transcriptional regulator
MAQVILAFPMTLPHLLSMAQGIRSYAEQKTQWNLATSPETHSIPVSCLDDWDGDGALVFINNDYELKIARHLKCPVVNLSNALRTTTFPRVRVDLNAVGAMAAQHLIVRGFRHLAFYGLKDVFYSACCCEGFAGQAKKCSVKCHLLEDPNSLQLKNPWKQDRRRLECWLSRLEKPVGIMASHDHRAVIITEACHRLGLRIPQDVAVLGMNNDQQTCELSEPAITSIDRNGSQVGWEAAALLHKLMDGCPEPHTDIIIPPGSVVERASTDVVVTRGHELEQALNFIHSNYANPIGVWEIAHAAGKSRRWVEYAFRRLMMTTPHDYLNALRIRNALRLLQQPSVCFKQVASEVGFHDTRQLNRAVLHAVGKLPREMTSSSKN